MSFARGAHKFVYNLIFRRTYSYVVYILAGSLVAEYGINRAVEYAWEKRNKDKLWKYLEPIYREKGWLQE